MAAKKYKFHEWWCPCSDPNVTHLYPKWGADLNGSRRAVCGKLMGGGANGRYGRQPFCSDCLAKVAKAEEKLFLKLCKENKRLIFSVLNQIIKLGNRAQEVNSLLLGSDE
jgi:hypothetical protein